MARREVSMVVKRVQKRPRAVRMAGAAVRRREDARGTREARAERSERGREKMDDDSEAEPDGLGAETLRRTGKHT